MQDNPSTTVPDAPASRWPFFLIGVVLFILGPVIYAVQSISAIPPTPWYLPILATLGVVLMLLSVVQRGGILRIIFLVPFAVLCAFEWYMLTVMSVTPAYTGPAQPDKKIPAFATTRADGRTFTNNDLEDGKPSVLVFNRGRW
jgi:hypothetical protein